MDKDIMRVAELIKKSAKTVVVTGAGISTEAGIPDFRGADGIYRKLGEDRVMGIINIDFFRSHPEEFYRFYNEYFIFPEKEPSQAHYILADWEKRGYIEGIVTQNIDNLHQKAGAKRVIAIHSNADYFVCTNIRCKERYSSRAIKSQSYPDQIPRCDQCSSILKPDVVLFGENIYGYMDAQEMVLTAQVLIVIGSSLTVYPLAGFVREYSNTWPSFKHDLVIINKGPTALDHVASVKLEVGGSATTGQILQKISGLWGKL